MDDDQFGEGWRGKDGEEGERERERESKHTFWIFDDTKELL